MKALDQIDSKTLKVAEEELNGSGLYAKGVKNLRSVGVSKGDRIKAFTEMFETLVEKNAEALGEKCPNAVSFYNETYADEAEGEGTEITEVISSTEELKLTEEKPPKEKKVKEPKPPKEKKVKEEKPVEERVSRKGMTPEMLAASAKVRFEFMNELIETGSFTKKEIIEKTREKFPAVTSITVATNISDGKNPKYNKFKNLIEVVDGKICFKK